MTTTAEPDTLIFPIDLRPHEVRAFLANPPRKSTITRLVTRGNSTVNGYAPSNYRWPDLWFDHATARTQSLLAVAIAGPKDAPTDVHLSVPYAGLDYTRADPVELLPSYRVRCKWEDGDELWCRETFWAKHDTDSDGFNEIDCGPVLDCGPDCHPGIQYKATPPGENPPSGARAYRKAKPGHWWEGPPDDWDGSDYHGRGKWEFMDWGLYSTFGPVVMPRWASRLTLTVRSLHVHRLQDVTQEQAIAAGVGFHRGRWTYDGPDGLCQEPDWRSAYRSLCIATHGAKAWEDDRWAWTAAVDVAVKTR